MVLVGRSSARITFGGGRKEEQGPLSPGPGSYGGDTHNTFARSAAASFGTGGQVAAVEKKGPGPGSYNVQGRQRSGGWSLAPRRARVAPSELKPGPGAYGGGREFTTEGPKYSMATPRQRPVPWFNCEPPGPGAYAGEDPRAAWTSTRKKAPGFGFGTSVREPRSHSTPGPGQYSTPASPPHMLSGPAFGISPRRPLGHLSAGGRPTFEPKHQKHDKNVSDAPGPGAHDHHPEL